MNKIVDFKFNIRYTARSFLNQSNGGNMRSVGSVINAIVAELPEEKYSNLRSRLSSLKNRAAFTAPEQQRRYFGPLGEILSEELGEPNGDPVKEKIGAIIRNEVPIPEEEVAE